MEGRWLFVFVTSVCLAISAIYDLIEWQAVVAPARALEQFLGRQGDS